MKLSLIVNGTTVVSLAAEGFNAEKFNTVRLKLAQAVVKAEKHLKVIKEDTAVIVKIAKKHKDVVKENTVVFKGIITEASACWTDVQEKDFSEASPVAAFMKKTFNDFDAFAKNASERDFSGYNAMQINKLVMDASFRSLRLEFFLTEEEDDSFGINRFKLLILQIRTGYKVTKVKVDGGFSYVFNLNMLCPGLNLIAAMISNQALMAIMVPMMECYETEMNKWLKEYMSDWNVLKSDLEECEAPAIQQDPLYVLLDE